MHRDWTSEYRVLLQQGKCGHTISLTDIIIIIFIIISSGCTIKST